jgi:hypothetical protein
VTGVFALAALLVLTPPLRGKPSDRSFLDRAWSLAGAIVDEDSRYYLKFGGITTGAGFSVGPGVRLKGLVNGRFDVNTVAVVSHRKYLLAEASVTTDALVVPALRTGLFVRRKYFPQEDFFGVGIGSREADRVTFTYDETAAGALATLGDESPLRAQARLEFRHPDVGGGHDGSHPSVEALFADATAPGLDRQPDFLVGSAAVAYDDATPAGRPSEGGRYEATFSRYWGRGTSAYDFARLDVDLRHYLAVAGDEHVLALRGAASVTGAPAGARVPFYYLPRLGGGESLRAVQHFRFYDGNSLLVQAEYRWRFSRFVEAAWFYDAGTVAPRVADLALDRLFSDVGVGVRFGTGSNAFLRIEAAFGQDDTSRVFVKFSGGF